MRGLGTEGLVLIRGTFTANWKWAELARTGGPRSRNRHGSARDLAGHHHLSVLPFVLIGVLNSGWDLFFFFISCWKEVIFFFPCWKLAKRGTWGTKKTWGKKKKWTGGLVADWRTSSSHLESISANEMADQDNEPNAGMLTIESALSQLGMNERIWIFKNNFTFPQIDHWR